MDVLNATVLVVTVGNGDAYNLGSDLAARLAFALREHSTSGKQRPLGVNNLSNKYFRTPLVHGARAARPYLATSDDVLGYRLRSLTARLCRNVAIVATANRQARSAAQRRPSPEVHGCQTSKMGTERALSTRVLAVMDKRPNQRVEYLVKKMAARGRKYWEVLEGPRRTDTRLGPEPTAPQLGQIDWGGLLHTINPMPLEDGWRAKRCTF